MGLIRFILKNWFKCESAEKINGTDLKRKSSV